MLFKHPLERSFRSSHIREGGKEVLYTKGVEEEAEEAEDGDAFWLLHVPPRELYGGRERATNAHRNFLLV